MFLTTAQKEMKFIYSPYNWNALRNILVDEKLMPFIIEVSLLFHFFLLRSVSIIIILLELTRVLFSSPMVTCPLSYISLPNLNTMGSMVCAEIEKDLDCQVE